MKNTLLVIYLLFIAVNFSYGQNQVTDKYTELIEEALELYKNKEFLKSGEKFSEAFIYKGNKEPFIDRYNAACSWALANEIDSSFIQLFTIIENGKYTNLEHISTDSDLNALHSDERWTKVIETVKSNKEKAEVNLDKTLLAILDSIFEEDQKYRLQIEDIEKRYGRQSKEMKKHWKKIGKIDKSNLVQVKKILDERGWLGPDIIGDRGNSTLFLVIQHADIKTQENYLPMMREAVKKGNAKGSSLALLEDRVALRKGEKQIYGSQIGRDRKTGEYYVLPLIDPDNVNKRRSEVGLGTIQDYISNWGITWDVEEYKKKLPEYEAKQKR